MLDLRTTLNIMQKQNQKKQKNSSQKKEKRLLQAEGRIETTFRLGDCATKYAQSLADPFDGPEDACLPVTPALPSRKMRCFSRTSMVIGTAGYGFVTQQPAAGYDGSTAAGSIGTASGYVSSAAFTGGASAPIPVLNTATAGVIAVNHNSDYLTSSFGAQNTLAQMRLVSMGFRLRYAGTELNRGGRIILLEEPDHLNVASSGISQASLMNYDKAKEHAIDNKWVTLCHTGPVAPAEFQYNGGATFDGSPHHYLMAIVQSSANNVFDVEFYWNFEVIGSIARGKTRSDSDENGLAIVLGAIGSRDSDQLDSAHPLIAAKPGPQRAVQLQKLVNAYAAKNASGWISKVVSKARASTPYIRDAVSYGQAALPYLEALL